MNHQSSISHFVNFAWTWCWRPCPHRFVDFRRMNSTKYLVRCAHYTILSSYSMQISVSKKGEFRPRRKKINIRSKYSQMIGSSPILWIPLFAFALWSLPLPSKRSKKGQMCLFSKSFLHLKVIPVHLTWLQYCVTKSRLISVSLLIRTSGKEYRSQAGSTNLVHIWTNSFFKFKIKKIIRKVCQ